MQIKTQAIHIRTDLKPESAKTLGFIWWKDVIYDSEAPAEAMKDIVMLEHKSMFSDYLQLRMVRQIILSVYIKKSKTTALYDSKNQ